MASMFKSILKNKIIVYLITRYATYALQFVVSIAIAAKLGPYYLGVYGFLTLILNYFSQINLGIPHSLNVLLVHNKFAKDKCKNYIGNSFAIYSVLALMIVLGCLFVTFSGISISSKYSVSLTHTVIICIIAITQYYSSLCSTVLRVKNKVNLLSIAQSSQVILNLCVVVFLTESSLIYGLLVCQLLSLCTFLIFAYKEGLVPSIGNVSYSLFVQREILTKGVYLFLYNSCFYFILISVRSIISSNYSVEEFGIFNFSFTLAHAILLLIEALMTVIFPKIIDLLSTRDYVKIETTIETIRVSFVSTSHFMIYVAMLFFPLILVIMPEFSGALRSMNLIALAILMNTNSYGYSSFLIAQNKERISARISFLSLIINIVLAKLLVSYFNVDFSFVILSVAITYLCFSLMVVIESKKIMDSLTFRNVVKSFFPVRLLLPYIVALLISILNIKLLIFVPLLLFVCLNYKDVQTIIELGRKLINNANISDV